MRGLALYAGFVIFWTAGAILIGKSIERYITRWLHRDAGIILRGFSRSWIATVLVMDGSLKNFKAEKEQLEAEKKGREYLARNM